MIFFFLLSLQISFASATDSIGEACEGRRGCSSLSGIEQNFCEAYKQGRPCFSSLHEKDQTWCEILKEGRGCGNFSSSVPEKQACESGRYPDRHRFWADCGRLTLPKPPKPDLIGEACEGLRGCSSLSGPEQSFCEAYKAGRPCFSSFHDKDQTWCEILKEGRGCGNFSSSDPEKQACESGRYPAPHAYWAKCGGVVLPELRLACEGTKRCALLSSQIERGMCEAYKENRGCSIALTGINRAWCEVLMEGRSCSAALNGSEDRLKCENKSYPSEHTFWDGCRRPKN